MVAPWGSTSKIDDAIARVAADQAMMNSARRTPTTTNRGIATADAAMLAQAVKNIPSKPVNVMGADRKFMPQLPSASGSTSSTYDFSGANSGQGVLGYDADPNVGLGAVDWEEVQRRIDAQNAASAAETITTPDPVATVDPVVTQDPVVETLQTLLTQPQPVGGQYYRPQDMEETIRDLFGERQAKDLSQNIIDLITGRRTSLTEAEGRRDEQIGEIARTLTGDIGTLEANRMGQQQALIDAIAGRAGGLTTGSTDRIAAARQALGPQVTDEFEQAATLASGLASSQAASSQDAMSRLAQIANMASAERQAAPAQLAAESRLALGDEAFRVLQGLNAEESERLLSEQLRQEEFNQARDQDMINALLGDEMRREQFLVDEGMRLQGQDYQAGQAQLDRDFRQGESQLDRDRRILESDRDFKLREKAFDADELRANAEAELATAQSMADVDAAVHYNVPVSIWANSSDSEKRLLVEDFLAKQDQVGSGFVMGSRENMINKYGEDNQNLIDLADELRKIYPTPTGVGKGVDKDNEKINEQRLIWLNDLTEAQLGQKGALDKVDTQLILKYLAEMEAGGRVLAAEDNEMNRIRKQREEQLQDIYDYS